MDEVAERQSWKTLPEPVQRERFTISWAFSKEQGDKLRRGLIPRVMEERWFVFYESGWLFCCRSWTGAFIFGLRLVENSNGVEATECWVSRDPEQYLGSSIEEDKAALTDLISYMLERDPTDEWW
jgi:hypothetical protein